MIEVVPATVEHALDLGPRLRMRDVEEIKAACGMDGTQALVDGVNRSWRVMTWLCDGKPFAIAGAVEAQDDPGIGIIWMLASDDLARNKRWLLKDTKQFVDSFFEKHDMLFNFVDNRHTEAHSWLQWLGFDIGEPQTFGVAKMDFRPFWKRPPGAHGIPRQGTSHIVSR